MPDIHREKSLLLTALVVSPTRLAIATAYYRGKLVAHLARKAANPGTMASIALSEDAVTPYLTEINQEIKFRHIAVGCANSPSNVTVTGTPQYVDALTNLMDQKGIFARRLQVDVAYHSRQMEEISYEYIESIQHLSFGNPLKCSNSGRTAPVIFSSVTGNRVSPDCFSCAAYWATNLVSKVKFSDALQRMALFLLGQKAERSGANLLVEVGPHAALQRPVKDTVSAIAKSTEFDYDSLLKRETSDLESCIEFIGRLRCSGYPVDLIPVNCPTKTER